MTLKFILCHVSNDIIKHVEIFTILYSGGVQITWLDDTSAIVALYKKDQADLGKDTY